MKKILLFGLSIFALIISFSTKAEDSSFNSSLEHNNTVEQQGYSVDELYFMTFKPQPKPILMGLDDALYLAKGNVSYAIEDKLINRILYNVTNEKVTYSSVEEIVLGWLTPHFRAKRCKVDGKNIIGSAFPKKYLNEINKQVGSNIWLYLELVDEFFKCSDKIIETAPKTIIDNTSVKEAQQLLNYLGYKAGSEDGVFGLTTAEALVEFGQANKIEHASLGFITDSVLVELRNCKELNKCFVEK